MRTGKTFTDPERESLAASIRESDLSYADRWVTLEEFRIDDFGVVFGLFVGDPKESDAA